ncbi:3-dehydroquinate synthase II, partial [Halobium palmae]
ELGDVRVAAFRSDADVVDEAEDETAEPDAYVVGKDGEGDGTDDLPGDFSGSADLTTLRRSDNRAQGAYVRIFDEEYEAFAEAAAHDAEFTIVVGENWQIIPLENLIARIGEETSLVAGVTSAEEAKTAFETLELGADAVLLDASNPDEIRGAVEGAVALAVLPDDVGVRLRRLVFGRVDHGRVGAKRRDPHVAEL